jgi:HK97 gp10 family phage protein
MGGLHVDARGQGSCGVSVSYTVRNKDRFLAGLKASVPTLEKEVNAAVEASATEMVASAKSFVPVDEGDLRDSIAWTRGVHVPENSNVRGVGAGGGGADSVTVHAGNAKAWYAAFVEFGAPDKPKQPYFFPAYRIIRKKMKARISRAMTKAIKRAGF